MVLTTALEECQPSKDGSESRRRSRNLTTVILTFKLPKVCFCLFIYVYNVKVHFYVNILRIFSTGSRGGGGGGGEAMRSPPFTGMNLDCIPLLHTRPWTVISLKLTTELVICSGKCV